MPGLLKKTARCPKCGERICALVHHASPAEGRAMAFYYHERRPGFIRRKRPCKMGGSAVELDAIRRTLEVHAA